MAKYSRQLSDDALKFIYGCYDRGIKVRECHAALIKMSGPITSERNVRKYYDRAKENPNQGSGKPVDWDDIKTLEHWRVRLDHLPMLRRVEAWVTSTFGTIPTIDSKPTYRAARWQSHILSYSHSINAPLDIWVLGELWAIRETYAVYQNKDIDKDDLEQWLSFAPWEDAENSGAVPYLRAVGKGLIPKLSTAPNGMTLRQSQFLSVGIANILGNLAGEQNYLLPSQQMPIYQKETGSNVLSIAFTVEGKQTKINLELGSVSGQ